MRTEITGTLTPYTLMNSAVATQEHVSALFKRAAILCDRIFIDTFGLGPPEMQDIMVPRFAAGARDHLRDVEMSKDFWKILVRPQDIGDEEEILRRLHGNELDPVLYAAARQFAQEAQEEVLEPLAAPWRSVDYKVRGALAIELTSDLMMPERLRDLFSEPVGIVTPWHETVLIKAGLPSPTGARLPGLLEVLGTEEVGDFGQLPWPQIYELRRSDFIKDFRTHLTRVAADPTAPDLILDLNRELRDFAARSIPDSMPKTIVKGVLANLPMPLPVNPIGIVESAAEAKKQYDLRKQFGWLFFVLEAKRLTTPKSAGRG